jgi:hypothetical protein
MILQTVKNECARFGGHVDIKVLIENTQRTLALKCLLNLIQTTNFFSCQTAPKHH